jgi:hypothetical protein
MMWTMGEPTLAHRHARRVDEHVRSITIDETHGSRCPTNSADTLPQSRGRPACVNAAHRAQCAQVDSCLYDGKLDDTPRPRCRPMTLPMPGRASAGVGHAAITINPSARHLPACRALSAPGEHRLGHGSWPGWPDETHNPCCILLARNASCDLQHFTEALQGPTPSLGACRASAPRMLHSVACTRARYPATRDVKVYEQRPRRLVVM